MGAFKKLNKQDAYISTYTAHKPWLIGNIFQAQHSDSTTFESEFGDYGITRIFATGSFSNSIAQLYYPSKSQGNVLSHSYEYYYPTTLYNSQSRNFNISSSILSIPRNLYGNNIQPDTFRLEVIDKTTGLYVDPDNYTEANYFTGYDGETNFIVDDGEGALYIEGTSPKQYIGDIIYSHGLAILTTSTTTIPTISADNPYINSIAFNSSHPIYTHNYHCRVRESEYNFTYNPSAVSSSVKTIYNNEGDMYSTSASISDGVIKNNLTGSSFQPYITTVGLYNDANELIAVGKMSQPVPKPANTEMTIIVKIDI